MALQLHEQGDMSWKLALPTAALGDSRGPEDLAHNQPKYPAILFPWDRHKHAVKAHLDLQTTLPVLGCQLAGAVIPSC